MRLLALAALAALSACSTGATAPGQTRQAACGDASDETLTVMQGLSGPCSGCHVSGTRAFFSSVSSFQNLLAANPAYVVPGDPDSSELVKLLEGTSTGAFKQMPIGTKTYSQLLAEGSATLSIDAVKDWIRTLGNQSRDARPDSAAPRITRLGATQMQRALYQQLGLTHDDFFISANEYGVPMAESRGEGNYPVQPPDSLPSPRQIEPAGRAIALGAGNAPAQKRADPTIASTFVLTITQVSQRWCRMAIAKAGNTALFPAGTTSATDEANVRATIRRWYLHFLGRHGTDAEVDALYTQVWKPLSTPTAEPGWTGLCSTFVRHPEWIFY